MPVFNPSAVSMVLNGTTEPTAQDCSQSLLSQPVVPNAISPPNTTTILPDPSTQEIAVNGNIRPTLPGFELPPNLCCYRSCKHRTSGDQLRVCAAIKFGCTKFIHSFCYGITLIKKQGCEALIDPVNDRTLAACSKRCHNKVKNALANNTYPLDNNEVPRLAWERDGREGPTDINNSMRILLEWMTEHGGRNYIQFRGRNNSGMNKQAFAEVIAQRINSSGVKVHRTAKHVLNKIGYLEKTFRSAHDFAVSQTGSGLLANDDVESFQKAIEKRCPYYDELLPVFEDRASARARVTNENLDDDDDYDEDNYDDDDDDENNDNQGGIAVKEVTKQKITQSLPPPAPEAPYTSTNSNEPLDFFEYEISKPYDMNYDDDESVASVHTTPKAVNNNRSSTTRPITVSNSTVQKSNKKQKNLSMDEVLTEYVIKKEEQAMNQAIEVRRHNQTMEEIAQSTAHIEKTKKTLEIGIITKSAELDNQKKSLELKIKEYETYEKLKGKGMDDKRIMELFPVLKQFVASCKDESKDHDDDESTVV
jgi:hypothetical protein